MKLTAWKSSTRVTARHPWLSGSLACLVVLPTLLSACGLQPAVAPNRLQAENLQAQAIDKSGPGSWLFGVSPNFSQVSNGRVMSAVSREFGRFARPGALINMLYPQYSLNRLRVAAFGFHDGRNLKWADELRLVGQRVEPDTARVVSTFQAANGAYRLIIEDLAARDSDVVARRVTLENTGPDAMKEGTLVSLAQFALTLTGQRDRLIYDPAQQALVVLNPEAGCAAAVGSDEEPVGFQCGITGMALGPSTAAGLDAKDGQLRGNRQAQGGLGTEGALAFGVPSLAPGQRHSRTVYHAIGRDQAAALQALASARRQGFEALLAADTTFWGNHLAKAPALPGTPREKAVIRRALIVMKQLQAESGGLLAAASTISPAYKYVWLQDLTADVRALSACGYFAEARAALDFVARVQKADGDWWVTYRGDGEPFKLWEHGSEWMGGWWVSAIGSYVDASGDLGAAQRWWPQIELACAFMERQITSTGLIGINMDLWETYKDKSWTLTNAGFVGGLETAARLAEQSNRPAQAQRWRASAERIRQALLVQAVVAPQGYFGKGVKPGAKQPDPIIDASVLGATWPFGVVNPQHPVTLATVRRIQERLLQAGGGVRRWEGDDWYGAQGWCELTDWLALVAHQGGNAALARRLHAANTDKAHTTGSLQLGEVFDERTGRFTSAFPLGWPMAQYVLTHIALQQPAGRTLTNFSPTGQHR